MLTWYCNGYSSQGYSLVEDIATKAMAVLSNLRNRERLCSEMIRVAATSKQLSATAGSISRFGLTPGPVRSQVHNQSHRYWIDIVTCDNIVM